MTYRLTETEIVINYNNKEYKYALNDILLLKDDSNIKHCIKTEYVQFFGTFNFKSINIGQPMLQITLRDKVSLINPPVFDDRPAFTIKSSIFDNLELFKRVINNDINHQYKIFTSVQETYEEIREILNNNMEENMLMYYMV